jgi:hypothetical protein
VEPAGELKIRGATKIRILFFNPSIVRYSPEEENRRLEKLELPERSKSLSDNRQVEEKKGRREGLEFSSILSDRLHSSETCSVRRDRLSLAY